MTVKVLAGMAVAAVVLMVGLPSAHGQVIIHPSATSPGAKPIAGSGQFWVDPVTGAAGFRYLGIDGQWHGVTTSTNPVTGGTQVDVYRKKNGNAATTKSGTAAPGTGSTVRRPAVMPPRTKSPSIIKPVPRTYGNIR